MEAFHFVLNLWQSKQITAHYTQVVLLRLSELVRNTSNMDTKHFYLQQKQICFEFFITIIKQKFEPTVK